MRSYLAKRIILLVPLLFGVTFISFVLAKSLPGDPVLSLVGERASPETIERIRNRMGAGKSFLRQYSGYLSLLARGEMGRSYYTNRKVFDDLSDKFPRTLLLAFLAMAIATPVGICLGSIAAVKKGTPFDRMISGISVLGMSVPVFWSGLLLVLFVSMKMKLLPPSGTGGIQYSILPAITLSLPAMATLVRVTRVSVIDVFDAAYVRTAQSKGIGEFRIFTVHVVRNALIPIVTVAGLEFGSYLNGAVLTETIFGWDGIGRYAMEGIIRRDYPVILGCILTGTLVFVFVNIVVDIMYHYIDPRVRLHGTAG